MVTTLSSSADRFSRELYLVFFSEILLFVKRNSKVPVVDGTIVLLGQETDLLIGQRKDHVVDALLLHEFDSDLLG